VLISFLKEESKKRLLLTLINSVVIFFLLIATSCNNPSEIEEYEKLGHSVLGVISTNDEPDEIFVYKTFTMRGKPKKLFEREAKVFIRDASGKVIELKKNFFDNDYDNSYLLENKFPFLGDNEYFLEVNVDDIIYYGKTTVPDNFEIKKNSVEWDYSDLLINVSWTHSNNSFGYLIELEYFVRIYIGNGHYSYHKFIDNFISFEEEFSHSLIRFDESFDPDKPHLFIKIQAFDENYYNHHFDRIDAAGVENAYGYFGSFNTKVLKFDLTP